MRGRDAGLVDRWLNEAERIHLSTIVIAELHYGVARLARMSHVVRSLKTKEWRRVDRLVTTLPSERFNDADAATYGRLRATLEAHGHSIGPYDLLIAAQALRLDAVIVTHNTAEFARVPGLKVEDWQTA